jgi:DNA-binding NarL/FixJ family response regulator
MINITLVEDHNIVRNGIKELITKEPDMNIAAEARNGGEVLQMLEDGLETNLIITDINMPGIGGLKLVKEISQKHPDIRLAILSMYDQTEYITEAFKNGAHGYILKNARPDELIFGIRHVAMYHERYICTELALSLLDKQLQAAEFAVPDNNELDLSKKEIEILTLVSQGYTNQEIADNMYTSKRTIEGHRQNMIDKAGVRNSSALIRYALINGLIS